MSDEDDQKHIASFENLGVTGVQALVNQNSFTGRRRVLAGQWLDQKSAATRAGDTDLQRRAVEASETQAGEAKKATRIALASFVVALLALMVAGVALFNDRKTGAPTSQPAPAGAKSQ